MLTKRIQNHVKQIYKNLLEEPSGVTDMNKCTFQDSCQWVRKFILRRDLSRKPVSGETTPEDTADAWRLLEGFLKVMKAGIYFLT